MSSLVNGCAIIIANSPFRQPFAEGETRTTAEGPEADYFHEPFTALLSNFMSHQ